MNKRILQGIRVANADELWESNKTVNTSKKLINFDEWQFNPDLSNWVNEKTGELISGYNLPPELKRLLHYNIISDIQ